MSDKIAPGKWDPGKREAAKQKVNNWGWGLIIGGLVLGAAIVLLDREVTMWVFAIPALPIVLGVVMVAPDIFTPLAYRTLDEIDGRRQGPPSEGE